MLVSGSVSDNFLKIFFTWTFLNVSGNNALTALISKDVQKTSLLRCVKNARRNFGFSLIPHVLQLPCSKRLASIALNFRLQKRYVSCNHLLFQPFQDVVLVGFAGNKSWVPWKQIINVSSWRLRTNFPCDTKQ